MTEERIKSLNIQSLNIKTLFAFISYLLKRFAQNRCSSIAAELTVTSLLALVPLTAVVFTLLAFIPSFQELGAQLQTLLFKYFVPGTGEIVQNYINDFVAKARGLSGAGTLMLLVTALLMMRTIDSSFNKIWQVDSNQPMLRTLLVYWAVLTLGPILLGTSLLITSYIQSLPIISDAVTAHQFGLTLWLPFLMATSAFSLMYYVIPNCRVPLKHCLVSGVLTALLFELAKSAFAIFVTSFSTYQLIFGALAAVPLFLIWIYVSWLIVLFGAEFCHAMTAFELIQEQKASHPFVDAVSLLLLLADYQKSGKTLNQFDLRFFSAKGKRALNLDLIEKMVSAGLVVRGGDESYCLPVAADKIDYLMVLKLVNRSLPTAEAIKLAQIPEKSRESLAQLIEKLEQTLSDHRVT